jgi:hypothetical protein
MVGWGGELQSKINLSYSSSSSKQSEGELRDLGLKGGGAEI